MTPTKAISNQKYKATSFLKTLSELFKTDEIYLAGGMCRDWYFGNVGEDYDIYLEVPDGFDTEFLLPMLVGVQGFERVTQMGAAKVEEGSYLDVLGADYNSALINSVFDIEVNYREYLSGIDGFMHRESLESVLSPTCKLQVIFITNNTMPVVNYIKDGFCSSLSKIYMDKSGQFTCTVEFARSVETKTIMYDWSFAGKINFEYIKKMSQKFPDFDFDRQTKEELAARWAREGCLK